MNKFLIFIIVITIFSVKVLSAQNLARYVNTTIGTEGSGLGTGFTYIGASYPFGMVQFTPSFFAPHRGFAINQLSGAGCAQMGNFPVLPMSGSLIQSPNDMNVYKPYKKINNGYAGYLSVEMDDATTAEFTVNKRSGIARFNFSEASNEATVIIGSGVNSTFVKNAMVKITSNTTVEGFAEGGEFCGEAIGDYRVYFAAEFDRPANVKGTWVNKTILKDENQAFGKNSGAWFTFDVTEKTEVNYRISISYVSIENAKENLKSSNTYKSFDAYRSYTQEVWNKTLGKIKIESKNEDRKVQFYTNLYHALIHPNVVSDANGEYMGADYLVHKVNDNRDYYSIFSLWDTYRTQVQLLAMLFPKESSDMMQSRVDFADQCGGYGRWILANLETGIMQGDPTPILIANAHAFGAKDFDLERAYYHMKRGATIPGLRAQRKEIRPGLKEYIRDQFMDNASAMLEYTSSDFAISQFANNVFANKEDASFFAKRAQYWKNIYNPEINWLCSRNSDGSWKNIEHGWREASYKNYYWMVPYNLKDLIDIMGGKDDAEKRLDELFVRLDASYEDDWFAAGNEPNFQAPWVYNWTNTPNKTTDVINRIFNEIYNSSPSGIPGNDDVGAMGAWYVFASIGLYPVIPGVAGLSVNLPQFEKVNIILPNGQLVITGGTTDKRYIKSLKLNNKTHKSSWINWNDIKDGGTINYKTTTSRSKNWTDGNKPPSFN